MYHQIITSPSQFQYLYLFTSFTCFSCDPSSFPGPSVPEFLQLHFLFINFPVQLFLLHFQVLNLILQLYFLFLNFPVQLFLLLFSLLFLLLFLQVHVLHVHVFHAYILLFNNTGSELTAVAAVFFSIFISFSFSFKSMFFISMFFMPIFFSLTTTGF